MRHKAVGEITGHGDVDHKYGSDIRDARDAWNETGELRTRAVASSWFSVLGLRSFHSQGG
jgi:hypothetical protein